MSSCLSGRSFQHLALKLSFRRLFALQLASPLRLAHLAEAFRTKLA